MKCSIYDGHYDGINRIGTKAYEYVLITVAVADFLSIFAIFINL
jgi:hypothetical protein